jgi:hypothetical protein
MKAVMAQGYSLGTRASRTPAGETPALPGA